MKIYIAAYNDVSQKVLKDAQKEFIDKFKDVEAKNFVDDDPEVIWFLTGGSEHNALDQIEPQKRYCFIANQNDNSWAAATEVKALLNEKGIKTRILNYDLIESLEPVQIFLEEGTEHKKVRLGMIGKPENWLVASVPDYELLDEVLGIQVREYDWQYVLDQNENTEDNTFEKYFSKYKYADFDKNKSLFNKLMSFISIEGVSALSFACFDFVKQNEHTACLPVSALNTLKIPATCEGDLCAAAGMIVLERLTGIIPWMANINYIDRECAIFSHCTAGLDFVDNITIDSHYESGKGSAIKGKSKSGQVTIFRIDHQLEYCYLSLGEIVGSGDFITGCRTQVKVSMSSKDLFLLREFPLGNHHLIAYGDQTDALIEYFTNKGFRIV